MSIPKDIQKIRSILNVMNVEYEGQVENQLLEFTHRTFVSFRICFLVILSNARRREKTGHTSALLERAQTYAHNAGRSVCIVC